MDEYRNWLFQITICDPACGSGAFLNQALEFLIAEHQYVDELKATLFGDAMVLTDVETTILENNLFGVDINEEAIEIARLSLWLRTAKKGRKLNDLSKNIKCGNSLIDDSDFAGIKAFNWHKEFPQKFNVVIGNPPYVRADSAGNSMDFRNNMTSSGRYKTLAGKWDLYIPFVELSIQLLRDNGYSSLIIPDAYCHANYSQESLNWLKENKFLYQIDYFPDIEVFENVGVKSIILNSRKRVYKSFSQRIFNTITEYDEKISDNYPERFRLDYKKSLLQNRTGSYIDFYSICYVSKGIVGNSDEKQYQGEFEVADLLSLEKDELHPKMYFEGKDIRKWGLANKRWIEYGTERSPYKWSRKGFTSFFEGSEKLVAMRSPGKLPRILLDAENGYFNESAIGFKKWIDLKGVENLSLKNAVENDTQRKKFETSSKEFSYKYLLCLLNSKTIAYELNSDRRSNIHIYPEDYKILPIPNISLSAQYPLVEKAEIMISKNQKLQEVKLQLQNLLKNKYGGLKLSNKMEDWNTLSTSEFLKELRKQKIKLTLLEEAEWMKYFEEQKAKANGIQKEISDTDKEIDKMVYELYELTEEEIKIVEGTTI